MPDGDSLNWKVRGKGSRKVLSLVRSGADCGLVADEAIRMFVAQTNHGDWKPAMRELGALLCTALSQIPQNADFTQRASICAAFSRRVEWVVNRHADSGVCILGRAAVWAFCGLEERGVPATNQAAKEELLVCAARSVLDHRVLQPTRTEVAREINRSSSEQTSFERDLFMKVGEQATRLHHSIFVETDVKAVRTPSRSVPKRETNVERLSEVVAVLSVEAI